MVPSNAYFYIVLSLGLLHGYVCGTNDDIPVDWKDPNDPTAAQTPQTGLISTEIKGAMVYDPTFRLILRQMFKELGVDPLEKTLFSRSAKISLSSHSMKIIGSYLEMETIENELAMREQVRGALHNMFEVYDVPSVSSWEEVITMARPWISMLNMMILPPALYLILRSIMSSRSLWTCILSILFVISMVTTYNRIYQEKLALRIAESMKRKNDACAPNSLIDQTLEYFSSFITFQKKSPCLSFIESQTVSIVAEISLLDVLSDVLSNSIFGILGHLGRHTNRFFREFYENVPIPAMLLMTVALIFTTVRIKTPIFTLEPMLFSTIQYTIGTVVRCAGSTNPHANDCNEAIMQGKEEPKCIEGRNQHREWQALRHRRPHAATCLEMRESIQPQKTTLHSSRDSSQDSSSSRSRSNPR